MTTENSDVSNAGGDTARRGRGPAKAKRVRRNYAEELATMQRRAEIARDLLAQVAESDGLPDHPMLPLIRAAMRLLPQGEA